MHGPQLAILLVAATLGLARPATAGVSDALDEARRRLARNEGAAAVAVLEPALSSAGPDRDAILGLLRNAYELAASQAEAAGRPRDAATFRENFKILTRKSRPSTPGSAPSPPTPAASEPLPRPSEGPSPLPEGPASPAVLAAYPEPAPPPASTYQPEPPGTAAPREATPAPRPSALLPMPDEAPAVDVATGDAAFGAKNYPEAGRIYAALARENRLPAARVEHWAYCRSAAIVDRINARPQTESDWASIDAEIDQIRALNPNNWLGEYLRNRAAERLVGKQKPRIGRTVVRASSPEEPAAVDPPVRPASSTPPTEPPAPASPATSVASKVSSKGSAAADRIGTAVGRWQIKDSASFRIYHADPALAEKVAQAAESVRLEQIKRWSGALPRGPWQPRCEIYLYPTARQYAQLTGQPEDSPGFSTMGMNAGRITSRRVSLRADHPSLVLAVLPHEITHVVLADVFPTQQIPRWADEGLAVLSEPLDEQQRRASDLTEPLAANRLFPVDALMSMDYPEKRSWSLYYAQSVSLTRFLVEQGTPTQMIQFLQGSQRSGFEAELRRIYRIDGYPDLQRRWLAYARSMTPAQTAAAPAAGPDVKVR